jgi:hypothetical protein
VLDLLVDDHADALGHGALLLRVARSGRALATSTEIVIGQSREDVLHHCHSVRAGGLDLGVAGLRRQVDAERGREPSDGGCVLVAGTSDPNMYAQEWLARVPFGFRIDGRPELRAAITTVATRFAQALADNS